MLTMKQVDRVIEMSPASPGLPGVQAEVDPHLLASQRGFILVPAMSSAPAAAQSSLQHALSRKELHLPQVLGWEGPARRGAAEKGPILQCRLSLFHKKGRGRELGWQSS